MDAGTAGGGPSEMQRGQWPADAVARKWMEIERRRRLLAERLARELANPDPELPPGALSDFVAATAVQVRWEGSVDAQIAFDMAPRVVALSTGLGRVEGRAGVVLWLHSPVGEFWSMVVPFEPFRGPVLVCTDDFYEHAMWITDETPESREALSQLHQNLLRSMKTRRAVAARGWFGPQE